jgi:hypothetical protein
VDWHCVDWHCVDGLIGTVLMTVLICVDDCP